MRGPITIAVALVLGLCACSRDNGSTGADKSSKEKRQEKPPPPPCHPGCFPAGTTVATPAGPRLIEAIQPGEAVTLVAPDGTLTTGTVHSTFQTCNRLVEVQTESGNLLTTQTQPLCLENGGFRPAGELAEGDLVWRWAGGERRPTRVRAVVPTGREVPVFNLVVGESAVFIADGFLARGKPPLVDADSRGPKE
jgi:hypothetical protein